MEVTIRFAKPADVAEILAFIRELAEYERALEGRPCPVLAARMLPGSFFLRSTEPIKSGGGIHE